MLASIPQTTGKFMLKGIALKNELNCCYQMNTNIGSYGLATAASNSKCRHRRHSSLSAVKTNNTGICTKFSKFSKPKIITRNHNYHDDGSHVVDYFGKVCYTDVKELKKYPEKYLIDVREPEEIEEQGRIPLSLNVPINDIVYDLNQHFEPEKFAEKYGKRKPHLKQEIIFTCKDGERCRAAAKTARGLGYKNVKAYDGGYEDWIKNEQKYKKYRK